MSPLTMKTSIVIATYNGAHRIGVLLRSIIPLLSDERELIIVDDGSQDEAHEAIQSIIAGCANAHLHRIVNSGRSTARNFGAKMASGEYIIFIDDDVEIPVDFLDRHESIKRELPDSWVTGTIRQKIEDVPHADFLIFRRALDYEQKGIVQNNLDLIDVDSFSTAQLCVRSDIFHEFHGFNEALRDCEDFELSVRVCDAGYKILHDTKNVVFHRDFSTFDQFIKRQMEYKKGRNILSKLNPKLAERFPDLFEGEVKIKSGLKLKIRKLMNYNFFWSWFFKSNLRFIFTQNVLNMAYDLVMSSTLLLTPEVKCKLVDD